MSAKRLAVIGNPVEHSLSPRFQTAAIRAAGLDAEYVALRVRADQLPDFLDQARGGAYAGFNVTIPLKERIIPSLDMVRGDAAHLAAVNTVLRRGSSLEGHNTDTVGFMRALERVECRTSATALILGTGGSARAVAYALRRRGTAVTVAGRNAVRARSLERSVAGVQAVSWDERMQAARMADLVVNATPLGMAPLLDSTPMPSWPAPDEHGIAFDLIYGRDTPFLIDARDAGWTAVDGMEMLVQQGAEAFRLWFRMEPNVNAMRRACGLQLEAPCSAF